MSDIKKASKAVDVLNETGLHARPASQFVQKASRFNSSIFIRKEDGTTINAKSIMGVLAGGIGQGASILLEAEGPDAEQAIEELTALIESKFGEE